MIAYTKNLIKNFREDDVAHHSAAVAFYSLFALAPFLIMLIAVSGLILGSGTAEVKIIDYVTNRFGPELGNVLEAFSRNLDSSGVSLYVALIGIFIFLYAVTRFFEEARRIFFRIFKIKMTEKNVIKRAIRHRVLSFSYMVVVFILITIFTGVNILFTALSRSWVSGSDTSGYLALHYSQLLVAAISVIFLVGILYRIVSSSAVSFRSCMIGGAFVSIGLIILNTIMGFYIKFSIVSASYGAAGFLVVVLLWLYYGAWIIFTGAEVAKISDQKNQNEK